MMEDTNADVVEEVVSPGETSEGQDSSDQQEEVSTEPERGSHEYNFREMRGIIERQQYEINNLKETTAQKYAPEPEEEEEVIPDDEIPNAKQVRKLIAKEATKKAEELLRQRDRNNYEQTLKTRYKDFDSVVTKENVQELVNGNPRLLDRLTKLYGEDPGEANEFAYELIKHSAFYADGQKKTTKNKAVKEKAAANSAKPVASHAVGSTPTPIQQVSSFKSMTQEDKYKLWQEMQGHAGRRK